MRRLFLIALAFLAFATADARALSIAQRVNVLNQCPAQVLKPTGQPCASVDANLATQKYWAHTHGYLVASSLLAISRASAETTTDCNGNVGYASSNALPVTCAGLQVWQGTTNDALYSSDLTQSGTWTASNVSAAKNATGPDNVANSASTITASAGAATILQAITLSSQADTYSVYVKCVICTGAISIAEYPSGTPAFTALSSSNCKNLTGVATAPNTSSWVRCTGTATVLNPVIGFQITNSADSIQVFGNQLETLGFASPLCPTTASTCARAADNITATGALLAALIANSFSVVTHANMTNNINGSRSLALDVTNGTNQTLVHGFMVNSSNRFGAMITIAYNPQNETTNSPPSPLVFASSVGPAGNANIVNSGTVASGSSTVSGSLTSANVGTMNGNSQYWNGNITRLSAWNIKLPNAVLQAIQ